MKDYFLEHPRSGIEVRKALTDLLPGQVDPWLLLSDQGDPIAYFNIYQEDDKPFGVHVSISGRHYWEDDLVLAVLRQLQQRVGGIIEDDKGKRLYLN